MLITKVKVGKVTNLSEARYCAGMGVDYLSFPVSAVDPKKYLEITGWVAGPAFGVEVENDNLDLLPQYSGDFVQINVELVDLVTAEKLIVRLSPDNWAVEKAKLIKAKARILFLEFTVALF